MSTLRPRVNGGDIVSPEGTIAVSASDDKDGSIAAVVKWVPVEVIAFYEGITTPFGDKIAGVLWYAIGVGVAVTFLWIAVATDDAKKRSSVAWRQVVLSTVAFLFWVLGTTSPDVYAKLFTWWHIGISPAI